MAIQRLNLGKSLPNSLKPLNTLTQEEYQKLVASGLLWDKYSNATGDLKTDLDCFVTISKLSNLLKRNYDGLQGDALVEGIKKYRSESADYYNKYFIQALKNEGLNQVTAQIVESICYEHGHSAGYSEVVNYSYEFVEFAKKIIEANKKL